MSPLFDKDLVVYVNKRYECIDLKRTIKKALKGPAKEKEEALKFLREHPGKCYLFVDALDEFHNAKVIQEVFDLAADGSMNVLITCREGHPYLKNKMENFTRHVKVVGFGPDDAQNFLRKFMKTLIPENERLCDMKTEVLSSHMKRGNVSKMYTSPINCEFLCLLYVEGQISDEELSSLTMPTLFAKQQEILLRRECHKLASGNSQLEADILNDAQENLERIHQLALYSVIQPGQKSWYTTRQLQQFEIDIYSPAIVVLAREPSASIDGEEEIFSWPHELIREFHAAKAVRSSEVINYIASKPELNVVTKFLLSMMADSDADRAKELLIAMFLLQSDTPPCAFSKMKKLFRHCCSNIPKLKENIHKQQFDEMLKQTKGKSGKLFKPLNMHKIQMCLRDSKWFLMNADTVEVVVSCIDECTWGDKRVELSKAVLHPFLPSVLLGDSVYGTLKGRPEDLRQEIKDPKVYWYPASDNGTQVMSALHFKTNEVESIDIYSIHLNENGFYLYLRVDPTLKVDDCTRRSLKRLARRVKRIDYLILDVDNYTDVTWRMESVTAVQNIVKPKVGTFLTNDIANLLVLEDLDVLTEDGVQVSSFPFL